MDFVKLDRKPSEGEGPFARLTNTKTISSNQINVIIQSVCLLSGALCIVALHAYHTYLLGTTLDMKAIIMGLVITHCAVMSILYNARLAWASPADVPAWIQKRVDDSVRLATKKSN